MALRKTQPTYDTMFSENIDQKFKIGLDGKTLQFYNNEGVKKVYEIHHYGNGKTLYFKKDSVKNLTSV